MMLFIIDRPYANGGHVFGTWIFSTYKFNGFEVSQFLVASVYRLASPSRKTARTQADPPGHVIKPVVGITLFIIQISACCYNS